MFQKCYSWGTAGGNLKRGHKRLKIKGYLVKLQLKTASSDKEITFEEVPMYYVSRFFVLGLFICSCMVMSDWSHKVELKRDIASVQAQTPGWDYEAKCDYTTPVQKEHKPHYSPAYKQ